MWVILTNIRRINLRAVIVSLLLLVLVTTLACGTGGPTEEELRGEVVTALDALAADLAEDRPIDEDAYMERLRSYLDAHPAFYGSAAALLDHDGRVTASPYVYGNYPLIARVTRFTSTPETVYDKNMGGSKKKNPLRPSYEEGELRDKSIEKKQRAGFQPKDFLRIIRRATEKAPDGA